MTLLEILVKELPGRGGWPTGTNRAIQTEDTYIRFPDVGSYYDFIANFTATDQKTAVITCEQYEAALAECKKVAWNGEGLPPVGVNCEAYFNRDDRPVWYSFVAKFIGQDCVVAMVGMEEICYSKEYICSPAVKFRPIRSEEERKREEITEAIESCIMFAYADNSDKTTEAHLYDAIAAGKIPHVKIV